MSDKFVVAIQPLDQITVLEAQLAEARADWEKAMRMLAESHADNKMLMGSYKLLETQLAEAREALEKYGKHTNDEHMMCNAYKHSNYICNCGFEQVLKGTK